MLAVDLQDLLSQVMEGNDDGSREVFEQESFLWYRELEMRLALSIDSVGKEAMELAEQHAGPVIEQEPRIDDPCLISFATDPEKSKKKSY